MLAQLGSELKALAGGLGAITAVAFFTLLNGREVRALSAVE